ncbi:MAG: hypothetical protein HY907_12785 [Deltaproteobacteria bacterium]|nr:hypothetical protein [Deltaproteobacteria bacterium]
MSRIALLALAPAAVVSASCSHDLWLDSGPLDGDEPPACVESIEPGLETYTLGVPSLSATTDGFLMAAVLGEDAGGGACRGPALLTLDDDGRLASDCRGSYDERDDTSLPQAIALSSGGVAVLLNGSRESSRGLWLRLVPPAGEPPPAAPLLDADEPGFGTGVLVEEQPGTLLVAWKEVPGGGEARGFLRLRRYSALDGSPLGDGPVTLPDRNVWWPVALEPFGDGVAAAWIPVDGNSVHVVRLASDLSVSATVDLPTPDDDRAIGIPSLAARGERLAVAWAQAREGVGYHTELALLDGATTVARGRWDRPTPPSIVGGSRVAIEDAGAFGWATLWAASDASTLFARFSDDTLSPLGPPPTLVSAGPCGLYGFATAWNGDALAFACSESPSLRVFTWSCRPPAP